jgi:flagellar biosynthetic protein FliR
MLTFFAVLVRYSILVAVLPFLGDKLIPGVVKVLLALALSIALFPALVARGEVKPGDALIWGAQPGSLIGTIALEALFGVTLGYCAKLSFDTIQFGANLVGTFMGFSTASLYDPHQDSQSQVVAEIQIAMAMLVFLAVDGHHLMLRAALDSYKIVGLGKASFGNFFSERLLQMTADVLRFGIQISAPVALSLFGVNVAFGIMAKAMPQINILVLSFSVSALVGLVVMFISVPAFQTVAGNILGRMGDSMEAMMVAMSHH